MERGAEGVEAGEEGGVVCVLWVEILILLDFVVTAFEVGRMRCGDSGVSSICVISLWVVFVKATFRRLGRG